MIIVCLLALVTGQQPNILFIFPDQWRGDYLELGAHTPNLRHLARQSLVFQRAYSSTPSCTPARTSLLTGQNQYHHGARGGVGHVLHEEKKSVYRLLQSTGYHVGLAGKAHFGSAVPILGFDSWYLHDGYTMLGKDSYSAYINNTDPRKKDLCPPNGLLGYAYAQEEKIHPTTWTGLSAIEWLHKHVNSSKMPFFLQFGPHRPHSPYDPPQRFLNLYNSTQCHHCDMVDNWHHYDKKTCNPTKSQPFVCNPGPTHMLQSRRAYLAAMSHVDHWIGKIIHELHRLNLYSSTMIVFASDHGDLNGDHFMWRKGNFPEGSCRIPLMVKPASDMKPESDETALVGLEDLAPTFLQAGGIAIPSYMTGHSLLGPTTREHLTVEHYPENFLALLSNDDAWKYVISEGRQLLFNLDDDPQETMDLSSQHPTLLQDKRDQLSKFLISHGQANNRCYFDPNSHTVRLLRRNTPHCSKYMS